MRKLKARSLSLPLFVFAICATFQNCSAGFQYDSSTGQLSASSLSDLTGVFGIQLYAPGGVSPLAQSTSMDVNFQYELRATGSSTSSALLTWSIDRGQSTATCTLSSVGNVLKYAIKCSSAGTVVVNLTAVWPDSQMTQASLSHAVGSTAATPAPSNDPNVVNFTIANGTQGSPWNTAGSPIQVFVGQTLRVYNADTIQHRIHANGAPFDHQADNTAPGATTNFAILKAHSAGAGDLYDHNVGTTATIYIEATDGNAAYAKSTGTGSCASCHGGSAASSTKRGASYTSITNAIANVSQMRGISLSMQEIKALVYVLNK